MFYPWLIKFSDTRWIFTALPLEKLSRLAIKREVSHIGERRLAKA
jgi:hypothetical protein